MKVEGVTLCCDIMYKERKTGRLEIVDGKLIKNEVYTDNLLEHMCPNSKTFLSVASCLQDRVFPRCRFDEDMKKATGLQEYNVYDILRDTHGVTVNDFLWLKFDGEDITWKDVKVPGRGTL